MKFKQDKFEKLKSCIQQVCEEWQYSRKPKSYADAVLADSDLYNEQVAAEVKKLPDEKVDRCQIREFVKCSGNDPLTKVLFVLAWGGMRQDHAKLVLSTYKDFWKGIVEGMLQEEISSFEAYEKFLCLRKKGKLKGMGPAYFTKLIFFLHPRHDGYIMDQWTARSMNLLRGGDNAKNVLFKPRSGTSRKDGNKNFYVDPDQNDVSIYSEFCQDMEHLAKCLGKTPEETEKALFSSSKGCWRRFVVNSDS